MPLLLTTAYFPPIEYFAAMAEEFTLSPDGVIPSMVFIEACENYQKQSYRNRCDFYAASGKQSLTFPVRHRGQEKIPIAEVEIDYSVPWIRQHERAIVSAYESSAFFDFYREDIFSILDSAPRFLFELNMSLTRYFIEKLGLPVELRTTEEWLSPAAAGEKYCDMREAIHPKRVNTIMEDLGLGREYFQVFSMQKGFIPNLSVMDLLFNEGPDSILFLKKL